MSPIEPKKVRHPHLLEISAWPWLQRLSSRERRHVTLASVPAADWDAVAGRGFHAVFLMGVWQRSPIGRQIALSDPALRAEYDRTLPGWTDDDVVGSPYCIQGYVPDVRMGGWLGLDAVHRALNSRGIALLLDFVPNHTALDHPWVLEHPNRYVWGTQADASSAPAAFYRVGGRNGAKFIACGRDPYFPPWRDVAQLNYFNPETRAAMTDVLRALASHCDGVRCDMAMLGLNEVFERTWRGVLRDTWPRLSGEFWPAAITATRHLTYLAEVYWDLEWTLQRQGFDFTYDKRLLDRLHGPDVPGVRAHLEAEPVFRDRLARFLENHDEPRSAAHLRDRLPAAGAMLCTLPGLRFFYDGQIEGWTVRTPVQLGRWREEPVDPVIRDMYERLLGATSADLFHTGAWSLLEVCEAGDDSYRNLIAYGWREREDAAIVVVNLGRGQSKGYVAVNDPGGEAIAFDDVSVNPPRRWASDPRPVGRLYARVEGGHGHVLIKVPSSQLPVSSFRPSADR